jgi:hypothetical protein
MRLHRKAHGWHVTGADAKNPAGRQPLLCVCVNHAAVRVPATIVLQAASHVTAWLLSRLASVEPAVPGLQARPGALQERLQQQPWQ